MIKLFALHFQSNPFTLFGLNVGVHWCVHTHTCVCVRSSIQYTAQHTLLKVSTVKKIAIFILRVKKKYSSERKHPILDHTDKKSAEVMADKCLIALGCDFSPIIL